MRQGKKSVSEGICYGAFDRIRDKTGQDPIKIFKQALDNVKPALEVKSRRVGGLLSGSSRCAAGAPDGARDALDRVLRARPRREVDEGKSSPPN